MHVNVSMQSEERLPTKGENRRDGSVLYRLSSEFL